MAIGDDLADIGAAAARLHPFAGPAAPCIMTDRARARLDRDMVRRRAGQRVAPCERRKRFFAAQVADRFVARGPALARPDVCLAVVIADEEFTAATRATVASLFFDARGTAR